MNEDFWMITTKTVVQEKDPFTKNIKTFVKKVNISELWFIGLH